MRRRRFRIRRRRAFGRSVRRRRVNRIPFRGQRLS